MPNVATLFRLKNMASYEGDGVWEALRDIELTAGAREAVGDDLDLSAFEALTTTVQNVSAGASNFYLILIKSPSGASNDCFIQVFNSAAADVTLGTTGARWAFHCPSTSTRVFRVYPNQNFATRLSIAATTTAAGSSALAAADRPNVFVLHTGA